MGQHIETSKQNKKDKTLKKTLVSHQKKIRLVNLVKQRKQVTPVKPVHSLNQ